MVEIALVLFYLFSLGVVFWLVRKKYRRLDYNETNKLMSDILEVSFFNKSASRSAERVLHLLQGYYAVDYLTLFLNNTNSGHIDVIATNVPSRYIDEITEHCNNELGSLGKLAGRTLTSEGGYLSYGSAQERLLKFSNFTALYIGDNLVGGVLLENKSDVMTDVSGDISKLYDKVFNSTALVLQNILETEKLVSMTSTDQLTGVHNRRFIDLTLEEQIHVHRSLGVSFSMALFDIDKFKLFNDTYGHPFGDIVLKDVATFMNKCVHENEWVARYGGEEFLLFFGRSEEWEIKERIELIREGLSRLKVTDGTQEVSVTASFGMVTYDGEGLTGDDLISYADKALYTSKERGRNRLTVYSKEGYHESVGSF